MITERDYLHFKSLIGSIGDGWTIDHGGGVLILRPTSDTATRHGLADSAAFHCGSLEEAAGFVSGFRFGLMVARNGEIGAGLRTVDGCAGVAVPAQEPDKPRKTALRSARR